MLGCTSVLVWISLSATAGNIVDRVRQLDCPSADVFSAPFRALFGAEEECITSLAAWQHMCTEARWVGRALFDAEEIVLRNTQ